MKNINNFEQFNKINEMINLSEDEKKYLWSKIEYKKKKKAVSTKNDVYTILNSSGDSEISEDEILNLLNSLEYSIKKQMKDPDKKFKNSNATSIKSKIPSSWIGVKYSSLSSKSKRNSDK